MPGRHCLDVVNFIIISQTPSLGRRSFFVSLNIIFNCTAGKDRTGILSCLLLLLAGVDKEEIIKDYLYSEECIYSNIDKVREYQPSFPKDLGHVKRKYIEDFLVLFEEKYHNVESYLLYIGLTKEQIDSIRNRLLGE